MSCILFNIIPPVGRSGATESGSLSIESKIMFLGCVIGRRSITIGLPPSGLAKNIILDSILFRCVKGLRSWMVFHFFGKSILGDYHYI
jgi:hypothetical protein